MKRRRKKNEDDENEDRLNNLPDSVLLHILSFLNTKHVVQTSVLSTRWKYLWKLVPSLIMHCSSFSTMKHFIRFVCKILTHRDRSTTLHTFGFELLRGVIQPQLLKSILNCVSTHNTHLKDLQLNVRGGNGLILSCVSSCRALTSLKLSLFSNGFYNFSETVFPNSLNLPALTSLDLSNFVFCGGVNGCVAPFLAFNKLNSLVIRDCNVRDAHILHISSETLDNLAMHDHFSSDFDKIELFAPNVRIFSFSGIPNQIICGSGLSFVKLVNIHAKMYSYDEIPPMVLFNCLLEFANVKSLTVSSTTLQILSLYPDLLEVEHSCLRNLKSMEIKLQPLHLCIPDILKEAMLKKAVAKSRKEAAKLRKAFKEGLEPPSIPDGIVNFLLQNSPSAKVDITRN